MKSFVLTSALLFVISFLFASGYRLDIDYTGYKPDKKEGRAELYIAPDGSQIQKFPDRDEARYSDGTVIIKKKNGERDITAHDGTRILIKADGTAHYKYKNGREQTILMDGYTHYGVKIDEVKRRISIKEYAAAVIYMPLQSDEPLEKYTMRFYNEFVSQLQARLREHGEVLPYALRIEVSSCRFCRTGYCFRNGKTGFFIKVFRDNNLHREIVIEHSSVTSTSKFNETAVETSKKVFSD
jgi:hypothetical protein